MSHKNTIYADYQATTPVDPRVSEKMAPYWNAAFGNPHSNDHIIGWAAAAAVRDSLASVAGLIGADPDEIVFTSGATEANNLALLGLARRAPTARRRILVSAIEHKCVLAAAAALAEHEGFTVEVIPVDQRGFIDLDRLESMLDASVLVASIMAVNNEVGTIQDLPAIAGALARHDIPFHCDAAQAPLALDLSGIAAQADLVSLSGHKLYGPQGIGALYIRRDLQQRIEPIIYGGGQQNGLRSGTVPVPLCVGLAAAGELVRNEGSEERRRVAEQRDLLLVYCGTAVFRLPSTVPWGKIDTPAMPTCALKAWPLRTSWARCSPTWLPPPGLPALQVPRSPPTCYGPWDSVRLKPLLPFASASAVLPPRPRSERRLAWLP